MTLSYELCVKLAENNFPIALDDKPLFYKRESGEALFRPAFDGNGMKIPEEIVFCPSLSQLIEFIDSKCNEFAIGYCDSGCFWRFQYGPRGAGSMMEGFGEYFTSEEETLDGAAAELVIHLLTPKERDAQV